MKTSESTLDPVMESKEAISIAPVKVSTTEIFPFQFKASQAELDDLKRRILATRWPEKETVNDQSQGTPMATMKALAQYWATEYDWRKVEAKLSSLPQFITEIDGLDIHFIHLRSEHENALPIIVTHGWPGSIIEQLKIILVPEIECFDSCSNSWSQLIQQGLFSLITTGKSRKIFLG